MGLRGPQRQPTEQLAAKGSWRAVTRKNQGEPDIGYSIPAPPFFMAPELRPYWDYAVSLVDHLRCVTDSDAVQLLVLSEALRDFAVSEVDVREQGCEVVGDGGKRSANPAIAQKQSAYARIKDSLDRLGLNPANRSRVTALAVKLGEIEKMPEQKKSRYAD